MNLFTEHTQSLSALQCDITTAVNPLLSSHLLRKLDQELRKKLESFRSSLECDTHSLPTVKHIIEFWNSECNQTEDASLHFPQEATKHSTSGSSYKQSSTRVSDYKSQPSARAHAYVAAPHGSTSRALTSREDTSGARSHAQSHRSKNISAHPLAGAQACFLCNQTDHKVYSCPVFLQKSPSERSNIVKSYRRCFSCLGAHMLNK